MRRDEHEEPTQLAAVALRIYLAMIQAGQDGYDRGDIARAFERAELFLEYAGNRQQPAETADETAPF